MQIIRTKSKISASAYLVDDNHYVKRYDDKYTTRLAIACIVVMLFSVPVLIMGIIKIIS